MCNLRSDVTYSPASWLHGASFKLGYRSDCLVRQDSCFANSSVASERFTNFSRAIVMEEGAEFESRGELKSGRKKNLREDGARCQQDLPSDG